MIHLLFGNILLSIYRVFLDYRSSLIKYIKFSTEVESNGSLPFVDVFITKKGGLLHSAVYRKRTHTDRCLHFDSNHPVSVKRDVVESLFKRANVLCQNLQDPNAKMYTPIINTVSHNTVYIYFAHYVIKL
jgi:hypothetical protein